MRSTLLVVFAVAALAPAASAQAQRTRPTADQIQQHKARVAQSGGGSAVTFPAAPAGFAQSPEPGFLVVAARARIQNASFPLATIHYWRMEVSRQDTHEVLWRHDYDRKPITVKGGANTTLDFAERLQFPAGRYQVRVSLLNVQWGEDFDGFPALVTTNADGTDHAIRSSYLAIVR